MDTADPFFDDELYGRTLWKYLIEHKERSLSESRRSDLLLGLNPLTGEQVSIPRRILNNGHMHITGGTGAGKTSATIMPLVFQILRGYTLGDGHTAPPSPVVIFDLKGDRALFHAVRHAAEQSGRTFRYLSIRSTDDYDFFDPFQMFDWSHLSPMELADKFLRGLMLDYGITYGPSFYTTENLATLTEGMTEFFDRGQRTLSRLAAILKKITGPRQNLDGRHAAKSIRLLAQYPQVDITKHRTPPTRQIDLLRAISEAEVVLFHLHMQDRAASARPLVGLALYTLEEAVKTRAARNLETCDTYVVIDEFYYIGGHAFGELISIARDWGLHFILANQASGQLKTYDPNLSEVIRKNTVVEQYYTPGRDREELEHLQRVTGLKLEYLESWANTTDGWFQRLNSHLVQGLSLDEIYASSDQDLASLVFIHDGVPRAALDRVRPVQSLYPIPKALWDDFRRPLPPARVPDKPVQEPISRPVRREPTKKPTAGRQPPKNTVRSEPSGGRLQARLQACWQQIEAEEGR
jgi:hypothetical protein